MKKICLSACLLAACCSLAAPPFSIIRFGRDLTKPGRWEAARDLLIRNRRVCDEVWFSTGGNAATLDWHRQNAATQAKAAEELRAAGIVASLQVQETVGHGERRRGGEKPSHCTWTGFTGPDGYEASSCWCPRDPAVQAYFAEIGRIYAAWRPGSVWIDDDLRLDRHGIVGTGCFCARCLKTFAEKEGRPFPRDALTAALKADPALARRWREHGFEGLAQLAGAIARGVHEVSPGTRMGLQYPWSDEGQLRICEAMSIACGGAKVGIRPGWGAYSDRDPFDQLDKTYRIARQMKPLGGRRDLFDQICPEIETCPRVFASRTPRSLAFEALIHLAQGCDSLSWYMIGAEAPADFDELVFPALRENMDLYKAYVRINEGTVPCGYDVPDLGDSPVAPEWPVRCAATAVPFAFGYGKKVGTVLPASLARRMTDARLRECFKGAVISDKETVALLQRRGLVSGAIKGPGRYALPEGGRLGVSPSLDPKEADSAELTRYGARADWAAKGALPAVALDPCLAAVWCRVRADGAFASLVLLNTRIDEQRPVRMKLRGFAGKTACWFPLWGEPETLDAVRDANGDAVVTVPAVSAWSGGFLAPGNADAFWPSRGMIAHRGDAAACPENTVPAFRSAVEKGAEMIELDVKRCKTGELVIMHDPDIRRTTTGTGRVENLTFAEIRLADAGVKRDRWHAGTRIPTLDEALACFPRTGVMLNLHCVDEVADEVALALRRTHRVGQGFVMGGFGMARRLKRLYPWVKAGFVLETPYIPGKYGVYKVLSPEEMDRQIDKAIAARVDFLQMLSPNRLDSTQMKRLHDAGIRTTYFVCNDPGKLASVFADGHDFVFTDNLSLMADAFGAVKEGWATGAERYLADCIALFDEYGWDWTYHALRESKSWDVELAPDASGKLAPVPDTPRKRALLDGLSRVLLDL